MGKGNVKAQRKRRRASSKEVERQALSYQLIDGNMSYYPYAYCYHYRGFLTKNMSVIHKCEQKQCSKYEPFDAKKVLP